MARVVSMGEMKIGSIAPWYGGKRTLAPEIIAELGPHRMYVEPFCGSLAVLMAKEPCSSEIVNDLHGDAVNLARVIASERCGDLYNRLFRTLCSEDLFEREREKFLAEKNFTPPPNNETVGDEHVERAYMFFVVSWMGRNGLSGTKRHNYQMARRWTPGGGSGGIRFAAAVDSMLAWHQRLRRVSIYCMDGFEMIEKIEDNKETAVYLDPPYMFSGNRTGRTGGARYMHEFGDDEHERLAEMAGRFVRARVVISYYDEDRLEELYPQNKWTRRSVARMKGVSLAAKRGSRRVEAPEVLLINGESLAEREGLFW